MPSVPGDDGDDGDAPDPADPVAEDKTGGLVGRAPKNSDRVVENLLEVAGSADVFVVSAVVVEVAVALEAAAAE